MVPTQSNKRPRCWWTTKLLLLICCYCCRFVHLVEVVADDNNAPSATQQQQQQRQQQQQFANDNNANIIGGTPVIPNLDHILLYASFAIPKFDTLFCGAILIWDDVLLTAAHCEGGYNFTSQRIMIGGTNLNGTDALDTNISIRKLIPHPDYREATFNNQVENDIMLLFLQRTTNPIIPLAKINSNPIVPPDNATVTVIGHGIDNTTTNELTYQLNALNMTIVNFLVCDNIYDILIEDIHLCAIGKNRINIAPCIGDSGGPLLYYNTVTNTYVVVGIVSFGRCTFQPNVPSTIYTRVSSYTDWILKTICTNSLHRPTIDMCNGIVPLERIAKAPTTITTSPILSPSSTLLPTTFAPVNTTTTNNTNTTTGGETPSCTTTTTNMMNTTTTCHSIFNFFRNGHRRSGTVVHRSSFLFGCIERCTIFPNVYIRIGWECGPCVE